MSATPLPPAADTPNRPPDWRWERAKWLNANGRQYALRGEDQFVKAVRTYQAARDRATTEPALLRLAAKSPGLYMAQEVFEGENQATRWGVEARLLAAQPVPEIAARTGLSADTVRWYECAFFNVLDRLQARDYIASVVIGEDAHRGINARHYATLWKLYGYLGGATVLDAVISQQVSDPQAKAWLDKDANGMISLKANQAARTVPVAFNQGMLLDAYLRLKQLETMGGGAMPADAYGAHIQSLFEAIGPSIAGGGDVMAGDGRYAEYDARAAEPRAHEILAIGSGDGAVGPDVRFPDPPAKPTLVPAVSPQGE